MSDVCRLWMFVVCLLIAQVGDAVFTLCSATRAHAPRCWLSTCITSRVRQWWRHWLRSWRHPPDRRSRPLFSVTESASSTQWRLMPVDRAICVRRTAAGTSCLERVTACLAINRSTTLHAVLVMYIDCLSSLLCDPHQQDALPSVCPSCLSL